MDLSLGGGLFGLLHLALVVYVLVKFVGGSASTGAMVIRVLQVLIVPLIGFIAWLVDGSKSLPSARVAGAIAVAVEGRVGTRESNAT